MFKYIVMTGLTLWCCYLMFWASRVNQAAEQAFEFVLMEMSKRRQELIDGDECGGQGLR